MDSFQFWLYVIIGVVYLISRMRKKSADQPEELPDVEQERQAGRTSPPAEKRATKDADV